jgi:Cu+-exporting ATPase
MRRVGLQIPENFDIQAAAAESEGATAVFFGWGESVRGVFLFGDRLKPSARETVAELKRRGIEVWMVSGDSGETTRAVAREIGIERFVGNALPMTKVEILDGLRERGLHVGMVGDGVNDAAALARADVGIAVGAGANLAREASDLTLLSEDPDRVLEALKLSVLTTSIIRQNLVFAFVYNLLGLPLAISGALNPLVAVFAMFASSLTVTWNTLRITRNRHREKLP